MLFGVKIEVLALILSFLAIIIAWWRDLFVPWFYKPKLEFEYKEEPPYRREEIRVNSNKLFGTFLRFSVRNVGNRPALNCRCQVLRVEKNSELYGDYQGFPLRWASRPEAVINQASGERLNIAREETEFIDLAAAISLDNLIHLQKYHNIPIGIRDNIEPGEYEIFLIFSGDNFKSYTLKFKIKRADSTNPNEIELKLIQPKKKNKNFLNINN